MILRNYYQPLCNYAYTFLQDKEDAEEIVQSTFLLVWEKRDALAIRTSGAQHSRALFARSMR